MSLFHGELEGFARTTLLRVLSITTPLDRGRSKERWEKLCIARAVSMTKLQTGYFLIGHHVITGHVRSVPVRPVP